MTNAITINNQDLALRQYNGQMVITFKDIDLVHNRPQGTAGRNFRVNKKHFIEGEDYFKIQPDEIRRVGIKSPNGGIVVTESGYLMLVKSFTDDLSWKVQRQLVKTYFRYKKSLPEPKPAKPYEYFDKTYNGVPVLTALDVEKLTGVSATMVDYYMKHKAKQGKDYYQLTDTNLRNFKLENPRIVKFIKRLNIITREGFIKFCRAYGVQIDTPKCFEVKEEPKKPQIDYNKFERAFSLGASSGKLVNNIKNDIITIQMICDFMGCGFHVYSDYDAYRKTLYEAVKKLYTYANDLRQIKLEC